MSKVVILGTGGTIASRVDPRTGHAVAAATGAELVETMRVRGHALPAGVELVVEQHCNVNSFRFDLELAFTIARRAGALLADPTIAGVVAALTASGPTTTMTARTTRSAPRRWREGERMSCVD